MSHFEIWKGEEKKQVLQTGIERLARIQIYPETREKDIIPLFPKTCNNTLIKKTKSPANIRQ